MSSEYNDLFKEFNDEPFLFRRESLDIDKFINGEGHANFISLENNDFETGYDDFLLDKSDTKSNSLNKFDENSKSS